MARRTKPAIPLKMYRHFAVATLCITGVLAMLVDNESGRYAAEAKAQTAPAAGTSPKASNFKDARRSKHGGGGNEEIDAGGEGGIFDEQWDDDGEGGYSGGAAASAAQMISGSAFSLPDVAPPGMSSATLERIKREQKNRTVTQEQPTPGQLSEMLADSLSRSGSSSTQVE